MSKADRAVGGLSRPKLRRLHIRKLAWQGLQMSAHPEPAITADALAIVLNAIDPETLTPEGGDRLDVLQIRAAAGVDPAEAVWADLITLTHRIAFMDLRMVWMKIGDTTDAEKIADHRFVWDIWDWRAESEANENDIEQLA